VDGSKFRLETASDGSSRGGEKSRGVRLKKRSRATVGGAVCGRTIGPDNDRSWGEGSEFAVRFSFALNGWVSFFGVEARMKIDVVEVQTLFRAHDVVSGIVI